MFSIQGLTYHISGNLILDDVNLQINANQHAGLVGRNGSGKTTLFKIILKEAEFDAGKIAAESGIKIRSVRQEIPSGEITPREFLLSQEIERNELMLRLENSSDNPEKIAEIYERLIQINAFDAEARAAVILNGLGFDEEAQNKPLNTFSGGFRMRIALGSILFQEPDLLLLDEPTNHLDLETTDWLQEFLKKYPKSFLLISHDRDFLNSTVDSIFHLKNKKITKYNGNFDTFLETYNKKRKNAEEYNAKMEEKRNHMLEFVRRFQYKATKAKQAQSRLKSIEKMKFIPLEKDDATVRFDFPAPEEMPSNILTFEKVSLGYDDKIILKNISGTIMNNDRIAIVGANGNGKTTFAKFLAGELKQKKGSREAFNKLRIGFYKQDLFEKLDLESTAYEHIEKLFSNPTELQIRTHLGRFGLSGDKVFQKIRNLSGGEKARLVFSSLTIHSPNLLILDEPTNHLDLEMRESLISTLTSYGGAVILITHDRHFLNRIADTIFVVQNGTVRQFNGDLTQYEQNNQRN